jgi:hypothetical protein
MAKNNSKSKSSEAPVVEEQVIDWAAIAALEKAAHQNVAVSKVVAPELLTFDEWWMSREQEINKPKHYKEILRVDAKARGLEKKELAERWDWAARQFGLVF